MGSPDPRDSLTQTQTHMHIATTPLPPPSTTEAAIPKAGYRITPFAHANKLFDFRGLEKGDADVKQGGLRIGHSRRTRRVAATQIPPGSTSRSENQNQNQNHSQGHSPDKNNQRSASPKKKPHLKQGSKNDESHPNPNTPQGGAKREYEFLLETPTPTFTPTTTRGGGGGLFKEDESRGGSTAGWGGGQKRFKFIHFSPTKSPTKRGWSSDKSMGMTARARTSTSGSTMASAWGVVDDEDVDDDNTQTVEDGVVVETEGSASGGGGIHACPVRRAVRRPAARIEWAEVDVPGRASPGSSGAVRIETLMGKPGGWMDGFAGDDVFGCVVEREGTTLTPTSMPIMRMQMQMRDYKMFAWDNEDDDDVFRVPPPPSPPPVDGISVGVEKSKKVQQSPYTGEVDKSRSAGPLFAPTSSQEPPCLRPDQDIQDGGGMTEQEVWLLETMSSLGRSCKRSYTSP
jgi:hypothetical protein